MVTGRERCMDDTDRADSEFQLLHPSEDEKELELRFRLSEENLNSHLGAGLPTTPSSFRRTSILSVEIVGTD